MAYLRYLLVGAALALWPALAPLSVQAQSLLSTGDSFVRASLLPGRVEPDGSRMAGLVLEVAPEWKTYWRNPGAAGVPPQFDWSGSRNLAGAEVFWPRPHVFESFGLTTLGYSGRVVFPVRLAPVAPERAMEIDLALVLGVCRDICVLEEKAVQAHIGRETPERGGAMVAAAEAMVPRPGTEQGLAQATCRISGAGKKRQFDAVLDFARTLENPMVVLEGPERAWFSGVATTAGPGAAPQSSRLEVAAALSLLDDSAWVDRGQVRITVLARDFAADVQGCSGPAG